MPRLRPRAVEPTRKSGDDVVLESAPANETAGGDTASNETYLSKVLAYVPIESVALYQAAFNQLGEADPLFRPASITILCATPFWQWWATRNKNEPVAWDQVVVSVPAFIFWLMGLQSPLVMGFFKAQGYPWKDSYGTFFLIVGSLLLPLLGAAVIAIVKFIRERMAKPAG